MRSNVQTGKIESCAVVPLGAQDSRMQFGTRAEPALPLASAVKGGAETDEIASSD
jgi:hypothetical protein